MEPKAGNVRKASASLTDLRGAKSPMGDIISTILPSGHDKALKYAFYNVVALLLAAVSIFSLWTVYLILEPFVKSLLWALLCGSVLYPTKRNVVTFIKGWIHNAKMSKLPFAFHLLASPLILADSVSDKIGEWVEDYWKSVGVGFGAFLGSYVIYYNGHLVGVGLALQWMVTTSYSVLYYSLGWVRGEIILTLIVAYIGIIVHTAIVRYHYRSPHFIVRSVLLICRKRISDVSKSKTDEKPNELVGDVDVPDKNDFESTQISEMELMTLKALSIVIWTMSFLYICGTLPYTILIPFLISMIAGTAAYLKNRTIDSKYAIPHISLLATKLVLKIGSTPKLSRSSSFDTRDSGDAQSPLFSPGTPKLKDSLREAVLHKMQQAESKISSDSGIELSVLKSPMSSKEILEETSEDEVDYGLIDSNKFLYGVFLACLVVQVWHHLWIIRLLPIPILYYGTKKLCFKIGVIELLKKNVKDPALTFYQDDKNEMSENMFPAPIKILLRIMSIADQKLCEFCEAYIDPVASSVILVVVIMLSILFVVFAATQFYFEGEHLVRVSIDLVNTTVSQHPEINELLPEGWESMILGVVDNAYVYGKEYITNTIRDSIEEKDPVKAREIEKQVIELWDKVYMSWNKTWDSSNISEKEIIAQKDGSGIEWNELLETGKSVGVFDYSILVNYGKANLGTLMSLMESAWNILIGNVSIAISAITSVLSVVLGGSSAIVNLSVNLVIFFTALFYLLNSSGSQYKPVELFLTSIPGDGKYSNRFLCAVEEAINGVFTASFKMAAFYGMWTWLIHSLFQINIVFVPSLLAALFGAVPLIAPYFAALPAFLEFLIQGEWTMAILMMLAQMAPMSMVDTQVYSEIKAGGHPYLTGLAVAGGIFYFGMQGAIIGPVILCCVVVSIKMSSSFLRDEEPYSKN